jgi:hypothetical protein
MLSLMRIVGGFSPRCKRILCKHQMQVSCKIDFCKRLTWHFGLGWVLFKDSSLMQLLIFTLPDTNCAFLCVLINMVFPHYCLYVKHKLKFNDSRLKHRRSGLFDRIRPLDKRILLNNPPDLEILRNLFFKT